MEVGSSYGLMIGWFPPLRMEHGKAYTRVEGRVNKAWTAGNVTPRPQSPSPYPYLGLVYALGGNALDLLEHDLGVRQDSGYLVPLPARDRNPGFGSSTTTH